MGKRSPLLAQKEEAVKALFVYAMQQSGETQKELERQLLSTYCLSKNEIRDQEAVPGKQWSRWANGHVVPAIGIVKTLFDFCVKNLITGKWIENGQEGKWAILLVAVSDQRAIFLSGHRFALKLAYSSLNAPSIITKEKIRGIESGYYIPAPDEIEKLFFTNMLSTRNNALQRSDRAITFKNDAEKEALQLMLMEIEAQYGNNKLANRRIDNLIGQRRFTDDGIDWADQLLLRMQTESNVIYEIADRLISIVGGPESTMAEAQIGNRLKQEAMKLQSRVDEVSMGDGHKKIMWKSELYFFNVKLKGVDSVSESKYMSVVEVPEIDYAGRHARDLHPHLFAPIL